MHLKLVKTDAPESVLKEWELAYSECMEPIYWLHKGYVEAALYHARSAMFHAKVAQALLNTEILLGRIKNGK